MDNQMDNNNILDTLTNDLDTTRITLTDLNDIPVIQVKNKEVVINHINSMIEYTKTHPQDDIQLLRKMKASTNKISKIFLNGIKDYKNEIISQLDKDQKEISSAFNDLHNQIKVQFDYAENVRRDNKKEEILTEFNLIDTDYDFELIEDSRWLNATTSMKSVIEDMNFRINLLEQLKIDKNDELFDEKMIIINKYDFSPYESISIINEINALTNPVDEETINNEINDNEVSNNEINDDEDKKDSNELVKILIKPNDLNKVKKLLASNSIYFSIEN